ncbi:uncharacterized protein LOC141673681 [Apium graveolens]|uniref:uncharacterized protein LOC141673681 n=1 Tax=Apium graveolens TaxID=4045 RepID=UPI003D79CED5
MTVRPNDQFSLGVKSVSTISTSTPVTDNPRTKLVPNWCLVTLLVIILGIIACQGYLVFTIITTVKNPKITIDSLKVSNFNLSSHPNQISADWNVQMCLKTMDTHGYLNFSDITVFVYYNHEIIGVTNLMPFNASPGNAPKHFGGEFCGSSGYIDDSIFNKVSQGVNAGSLKFDIKFSVWVKKTYIKDGYTDPRSCIF